MGLNTVRSVRAKVAEIIRVSGGAPRINKTGYSAAAHPNSAHVKNPCKGGVHIVLWITSLVVERQLSGYRCALVKRQVVLHNNPVFVDISAVIGAGGNVA